MIYWLLTISPWWMVMVFPLPGVLPLGRSVLSVLKAPKATEATALMGRMDRGLDKCNGPGRDIQLR